MREDAILSPSQVGQYLKSMMDRDHLLSRLDEEDFFSFLPELRLAFRYFTPMEAARIARKAAGLHGVAVEQLRRPAGQPGQYAYGEALDAWAAARL